MKTIIITVLFLCTTMGISAQITPKFEKNIRETLGKSNVSKNFTNGFISVGKLLGCEPDDDSKACQEVRDPWEESKPTTKSKISSKDKAVAMQRLEDKINNGEGGKAIPKNSVLVAHKKYSGNKLEALKARYAMYLKFCCLKN